MLKYLSIYNYHGGGTRGIKRCLDTFKEVDFFDLKRFGINTRENLRKNYPNINYMFYAPVYSSVSEQMIYLSHEHWASAIRYSNYDAKSIFVDLGCGSGKTLIQSIESKRFDGVYGVEMIPMLVKRGRNNLKKRLKQNKSKSIEIFENNVEDLKWLNSLTEKLGDVSNTTFFLFNKNSYGKDSINISLDIVESKFNSIIYLYQNPVHSTLLEKRGYEMFANDSKSSTANRNYKFKLFSKLLG